MRCGYCEGEMEIGFIQSPRHIFWSKKKRKTLVMPYESEGDIILANSFWKASAKEAHLCKQCGKIIMDI